MDIVVHIAAVNLQIGADVSQVINQIKLLEDKMSKTAEVLQAAMAALLVAVTSNAEAVTSIVAELQEQLQAALDAPTLEETNAIIASAQSAIDALTANTSALTAAVDEANGGAGDIGGDTGGDVPVDTGGDTGGDVVEEEVVE